MKTAHPGATDDPSELNKRRSPVITTAINDWTELASRGTDGLAVSLVWSRATDRVKVTVADERLEEEFDLDVPGAHALSAFRHPFAYAACRGLRLGDPMREPLDQQPQTEGPSTLKRSAV